MRGLPPMLEPLKVHLRRVWVSNALITAYPWIKAFHLVAVVSWMAGLFYLPRLFVYHAERATPGSEMSETFKVMERRLLVAIMRPAMAVTWILGVTLALTPGILTWGSGWFYVKFAAVLCLTGFHEWLDGRRRDFAADRNRVSGRTYRLMNEIPTVALVVIAIMVIVKPF